MDEKKDKKKDKCETKYEILGDNEHVLKRPGMYLGDINTSKT